MTAPRFHFRDDNDVDVLYDELSRFDLQPLWELDGLMAQPPTRVVPHHWPASQLSRLGAKSVDLVPVTRGGDRRVLALSNPGLGGRPFATDTLWAAMQFLGPRESAPPHRHAASALRFVLAGKGGVANVDGRLLAMNPGDLVLTPSWSWHSHRNTGEEPIAWFDALDVPLVSALDAHFFESPATAEAEPAAVTPASCQLVFPWDDVEEGFAAQDDKVAGGCRCVRYTALGADGDVLPTMRCEAFRVDRVTHMPPVLASAVWVVHHGSGDIQCGSRRFNVGPGDLFVRPPWTQLAVAPTGTLDCFVVSDAAAMEHLGLRGPADR